MSSKIVSLPLLLTMLCCSPNLRAFDSVSGVADKSTASTTGTINGSVKDAAGAVLQGAQIVLQPTNTTVASDAQGNFIVTDVKSGTYTLTISYVGFATSTSTITVTTGQPVTVNAVLKIGSSSQEVVVTANLVGDALAINEQRTSANILNVETDTQIQSLPNANIADAVGRLPGVTLQRNEGEGQYVQIRGTEPRLSNTTIDGVIVPGPDPEVRQVDLDTIPADLVGSVAINKTLSANQDGDAIGGSVDLRIKQATRLIMDAMSASSMHRQGNDSVPTVVLGNDSVSWAAIVTMRMRVVLMTSSPLRTWLRMPTVIPSSLT
jgi:hypothetical protein